MNKPSVDLYDEGRSYVANSYLFPEALDSKSTAFLVDTFSVDNVHTSQDYASQPRDGEKHYCATSKCPGECDSGECDSGECDSGGM